MAKVNIVTNEDELVEQIDISEFVELGGTINTGMVWGFVRAEIKEAIERAERIERRS